MVRLWLEAEKYFYWFLQTFEGLLGSKALERFCCMFLLVCPFLYLCWLLQYKGLTKIIKQIDMILIGWAMFKTAR